MRILLAVDKYLTRAGGADRSARALVHALVTAGHEVRVLEAGEADGVTSPAAATGGAHVQTRQLPSYRWFRDGDWRGVRWNILWQPLVDEAIADFAPDRLLTQNMLAPSSVAAAVQAGVDSTIFFRGYRCLRPDFFLDAEALHAPATTFWNAPFPCQLKWILTAPLLDLHEAAYQAATRVVANSDYTAKVVKRFFRRPAEVLYPTIDLQPGAAERASRPEGALLFIKPQKIKGVDRILDVARLLPQRNFVVAGSASRRVARQLAKVENIDHRGWVEDMDALFRQSALLLGPARIPEPFGRVYVEAALRGVPSVATETGGIPEAVGPGGVLLPPSADAAGWGAAIEASLAPERHRFLSELATDHARAVLTVNTPERLLRLLGLVEAAGAQDAAGTATQDD